jgi:hypothetical protein
MTRERKGRATCSQRAAFCVLNDRCPWTEAAKEIGGAYLVRAPLARQAVTAACRLCAGRQKIPPPQALQAVHTLLTSSVCTGFVPMLPSLLPGILPSTRSHREASYTQLSDF